MLSAVLFLYQKMLIILNLAMLKLLDKNRIIDSLKLLYDNDRSEWVYTNIERLLGAYQSKITDCEEPLCEKDVILITYGDNIQKQGQLHLQTLKKFIDEYCLPEINSTHILPFYPYTSDDGFSVTDYFEVDAKLGTWNDVLSLSQSNSLMFDAVVNHMSKSSDWFNCFLAQEEGFRDFFIDVDPNEDLSKVVRPRALPLLTPFKDKDGNEKHVWTTFSEDQVDLNYASPYVFIAVLEVLLFYVSKGAKYIRLDAIAFLWKKIGTTCIHLTETHEIIKLYRRIIESLTGNIIIITETNVPHEENISYFGNGYNEAQMVYNFTLSPLLVYSIMEENVEVLTQWAQSLKFPSDKVCFFNFTASHDGVGVRPLQNIIPDSEIQKIAKRAEKHGGEVSYKSNEDGSQSPYELNCNYMDLLSDSIDSDEVRIRKMMLTQSIMLAMPGVPGIYFHSLVGSRNYYKGAEESGIKRRINREKLNFNDFAREVSDKESLRHKIFSSYKKIVKIRTNQIAFNPLGKAKYPKTDNNKIFVIQREHQGETIYAVYNFSCEEIQIKALAPIVYDLLNETQLVNAFWAIEPFNFHWFKIK